MVVSTLGPPFRIPLPPSPPYSGDEDAAPAISTLINGNGLSTPERTPSRGSSFGEGSGSGSGSGEIGSKVRSTREQAREAPKPKATVAKLEDFQLIKVLGKGCAGRVLLVKHTPTNSVRAMKAVSKRSVLAYDELAHSLTEQSILRRFATEEPHNRFVCRLYNTFTDRENFYFVMHFYPGGDLATQMEIHGVLGQHRTRFYAADITQGLEDLHRHGIIVRDLKPENVLLNSKGHAVIADFGLSKEFSYRGEPKPMHVATYPGQPELPPWAGAGAGSLRTLNSGQKKLTIDRAHSFVGTSEYLSPEVVKGGEYSYAIDWWALGCIVFECLVGRVPFRKADDEAPMVLWNKIIYDPWDEIFRDPETHKYIPDPVSYSFIDALLQKDPMWRLTEPCIKQHEYFQILDWETVRRGEYEDPYGLRLHPVAEYNTHYFPKLCLEEDPSVDMTNHDLRDVRSMGSVTPTPLNDNDLYLLEQAKHKFELQGFAWSRADEESESYESYESYSCTESDVGGSSGSVLDQEGETDTSHYTLERVDESPVLHKVPLVWADGDAEEAAEATVKDGAGSEQPPEQRAQNEEDNDVTVQVPIEEAEALKPNGDLVDPIIHHPEIAQLPTPNEPVALAQVAAPAPAPAPAPLPEPTASSPSLSPGVSAAPVRPTTDDVSSDLSAPAPARDDDPTPRPAVETTAEPTSPPPLPLPVHLRQPMQPVPVSPTLSSHSAATATAPVPIPLRPKPVRQLSHEIDLPLGLPSSGLSVSEIISVRSHHPGSPTRIVRRHPQLPSVDTIPIARLSIELHGTITHIDDEEWEELVPEGPEASAPNGNGGNGQPHSLFGMRGLLRRRPSTLVGSGLRRQTKTSDSSSRGSGSPTKQRPVLFTAKSIENTKRAFGKLKTFPKPKFKGLTQDSRVLPQSHSHGQGHSPLTCPIVTGSMDGSDDKSAVSLEERPGMARRHTESGWLDKVRRTKASMGMGMGMGIMSTPTSPGGSTSRRKGKKDSVSVAASGSAPAIAVDAESKGEGEGEGEGQEEKIKDKGLPVLELGEFGRLDWAYDPSEWGVK